MQSLLLINFLVTKFLLGSVPASPFVVLLILSEEIHEPRGSREVGNVDTVRTESGFSAFNRVYGGNPDIASRQIKMNSEITRSHGWSLTNLPLKRETCFPLYF